jgi:hypothetical protein
MKILDALRRDQTLAVVFVMLLTAALLPLLRTPFLPFVDLHNNVGAASMLFAAVKGDAPAAEFYAVNWSPVPYWTGYVVIAIADKVGGALFAAKAICALVIVLLPVSVMRLLIALGRSPRQAIGAFLLTWDRNLYAGWVSFLLGMGIAFVALAWLIESDDWKQALKVTGLTALVALTHPQALAYLGVAGIGVTFACRRTLRSFSLNVLGLSGGLVAIVPWLHSRLSPVPEGKLERAFSFKWHSAAEKATNLFDHVFGDFAGRFESGLPVLAFVLLLLGPLCLAMLRPRSRAPFLPALVLTLSALALYAVLPFSIRGPVTQKHNYVRYASFILYGMLLIPRPRLQGRAFLALVPAIAVALAMNRHVGRQLASVATRAAPFKEIIAAMEPGRRLLPMIYEIEDPACAMAPYSQLHSYASAVKNLYDPYFFDNRFTPVIYRGHLPHPANWRSVDRITFDAHIRHYDYVIVQGLGHDPFVGKGRLAGSPVQLRRQAGMWRLYAVKH